MAARSAAGAAALLGALFAAWPPARAEATAGAAPCPPRGAKVSLAVEDPAPVVVTGLDAVAPRAEAGERRGTTTHHLALTTSRVEWRSAIDIRYAGAPPAAGEAGPAAFCAVPAGIRLVLVQAEHRIRIAAELPPGGCLYREVLAHEQRHVAVNLETLRTAAREARAAATAWAGRAMARGATLEAAMEELRLGLRAALEPSLATLRAERERRHAAIDSVAEYQRLGRVCPRDQSVLRERLRRG